MTGPVQTLSRYSFFGTNTGAGWVLKLGHTVRVLEPLVLGNFWYCFVPFYGLFSQCRFQYRNRFCGFSCNVCTICTAFLVLSTGCTVYSTTCTSMYRTYCTQYHLNRNIKKLKNVKKIQKKLQKYKSIEGSVKGVWTLLCYRLVTDRTLSILAT